MTSEEVETPTIITPGPNAVDITPDQDGGVLKEIIKEGNGDSFPSSGCTVNVYYEGKLTDGTIFDSCKDPNSPFEFTVGFENIIKGWEIGIPTMKKGEVAILTCQPKYAYGKAPMKNIPPDSTLIFEITLISWSSADLSKAKDKGILKIKTLSSGKGYSRPSDGALCEVHLTGKYEDKVYEDRDLKFNLGEGCVDGVIDGVEKALKNFRKGEKSVLQIKSKYAFKDVGNEDFGIPPNADVEYTVELKDFEQPPRTWDITPEERIAQAKLLKEKATKYFKSNHYPLAITFFNKIIENIDYESGCNEENLEEEKKALKLTSNLNLALVHLKLNQYYEAKHKSDAALDIDPENVKGLFRRGQAYLGMGEPEKAKTDFEAVVKIEPSNKLALSQIIVCRKEIKEQREKEKKLYANMFEKFAKKDKEETTAHYGWWNDEKKMSIVTEVDPISLESAEEARAEKRKQLEQLKKIGERKKKEMEAERAIENKEEEGEDRRDNFTEATAKENLTVPREADTMKVLGEWGRGERDREPTEFEQENPDILLLNKNDEFKNMTDQKLPTEENLKKIFKRTFYNFAGHNYYRN